MSVKIRLRRMGARNQPSYRVVVVDSRKKRDGAFIEKIGYYDPKPEEYQYKIDHERALYWLEQGAIPSDTVRSLLKKEGILRKFHENKYGKATSEVVSEQSDVANDEIDMNAEDSAK